MRRALKFLLGFIGIVVVVVVAVVLLIPRERIVALATDQVRAATGRDLTLSGDISPSFWPVLGVRTGPVTLSNADWAEAAEMISASAAEIGVELMPLLSGEVKVTTLRLVDPVVALEVDHDGRANWVFDDGTVAQGSATSGSSSGSERELPKISLPEAVISNGQISFRDAQSGQRIELTALDLTAGLEALDKPLSLDGSGLWNGNRATVVAYIDTPAAAMQGAKTSIRVSLASDPANVSFDGDMQIPEGAALPLVNGQFSINLPSASAAAAWATGADVPAVMADLGMVEFDGSVSTTDAALQLSAAGSIGYKGRAVNLDLEAGGSEGWLDRQAFTVAISGLSKEMFQFSFRGPISAGDTLAAEGPLKLTVDDPRALAKWIGDAALDAPAGMLESADLETQFALMGSNQVDLTGLTLRLDQTTMTGDAGISLDGARPMITARLNSTPLDLSPFMAGGGGASGGNGGGTGKAAQGWSTEPLDLSVLRAVDADVAIRAEAVDLGDIEIGRSDIAARLRNGRLDLKIDRVDAYGGAMTGTVVVVADDETALSTDLTISSVQMRPLLNALAGFDSLEGLGAFRIRADGRGRSMDGLMKSLDGQGALDLSDGAILGLNLAAMVRNVMGGGGTQQKTDFSAVTGTFDITDGVLHNTDFSFLGPLLRVVGAGTVDIGRQAQNFRLEPTAVASLTGQGGALGDAGLGIFPILVTGTWSNPSFQPDLTAAIEGLLSDPNKTLDAVTGLIDGADPGKAAGALLGGITGGLGDNGEGGAGGALGQVLGGVLGGGEQGQAGGAASGGTASGLGGLLGALGGVAGGGETTSQTGGNQGSANESGATGGLGGLLGALGGAAGGGAADQESGSIAQPTFDETQPVPDTAQPTLGTDGGDPAPLRAPLPAPAPLDRAMLSVLPGAEPSTDATAPTDSLTVPSLQFPTQSEPGTETVQQPQIAPSAAEPGAAEAGSDQQSRKSRKKNDLLNPGKILKGLLK
jgi:AsmA protein